MKKIGCLLFILLIQIISCNAQINNIENSSFAGIPVNEIFTPVTKQKSKDEKARKELWNKSCSYIDIPLDFDLKVDYFRMPTGKFATFLTAQIENRELSFHTVNQAQTSKVVVFGRIASIDEKMKGTFGDRIIFSINATELNTTVSTDKQSYIKGVILPSGTYKVDVILQDTLSCKIGIMHRKLQIPNF